MDDDDDKPLRQAGALLQQLRAALRLASVADAAAWVATHGEAAEAAAAAAPLRSAKPTPQAAALLPPLPQVTSPAANVFSTNWQAPFDADSAHPTPAVPAKPAIAVDEYSPPERKRSVMLIEPSHDEPAALVGPRGGLRASNFSRAMRTSRERCFSVIDPEMDRKKSTVSSATATRRARGTLLFMNNAPLVESFNSPVRSASSGSMPFASPRSGRAIFDDDNCTAADEPKILGTSNIISPPLEQLVIVAAAEASPPSALKAQQPVTGAAVKRNSLGLAVMTPPHARAPAGDDVARGYSQAMVRGDSTAGVGFTEDSSVPSPTGRVSFAKRRASLASRTPVSLHGASAPRHSGSTSTESDDAEAVAPRPSGGRTSFPTRGSLASVHNPLQPHPRRQSGRRVSLYTNPSEGSSPALTGGATRAYEAAVNYQRSRRDSVATMDSARRASLKDRRPTIVSLGAEDVPVPIELGLDISIPADGVASPRSTASPLKLVKPVTPTSVASYTVGPERESHFMSPLTNDGEGFGAMELLRADSTQLRGIRKGASWSKRKNNQLNPEGGVLREDSDRSVGFADMLNRPPTLQRSESGLKRITSGLFQKGEEEDGPPPRYVAIACTSTVSTGTPSPRSSFPADSPVSRVSGPRGAGLRRPKDDVDTQASSSAPPVAAGFAPSPGLAGMIQVSEPTPVMGALRPTAEEDAALASDRRQEEQERTVQNLLYPDAHPPTARDPFGGRLALQNLENVAGDSQTELANGNGSDLNQPQRSPSALYAASQMDAASFRRRRSHISQSSLGQAGRRWSVASSNVSDRMYDKFKTSLSVMDFRSRANSVATEQSMILSEGQDMKSCDSADTELSPWGVQCVTVGPEGSRTSKRLTTAEQKKLDEQQAWITAFDAYWVPLLFLYVTYQLVVVPLRCGLDLPQTPTFIIVDLMLDIIFWVEVYLRFRRPRSEEGFPLTSMAERAKEYLGDTFYWDLLIAFPLDLVGLLLFQTDATPATSPWRRESMVFSPWWRVNKCLLMRYSDTLFTQVFQGLIHKRPLLGRAGEVVCLFVLCTHYVACLFLAVMMHEGVAIQEAYLERTDFVSDVHVFRTYLLAYDYSLKSLVGMSRSGQAMPLTDLQCGWSIFAAIVGVGLYAIVLSAVGNLIRQVISEDEKWREKRDEMWDTFRYLTKNLHLPQSFCDELYAYFEHSFWVSRVLLGRPHEVLTGLPPMIGDRINTLVGGVTLNRVPMFRNVADDKDFINFMLMRMEPETFCKGEQIMTKGELGDTMYFLMYGEMGIYDEAADRIVFVCPQGTTLGEIALLHDSRRTATVLALEYCSCFSLSRDTFLQAESHFPDIISQVREEVEGKLARLKLSEIADRLPLLAQYLDNADFVAQVLEHFTPQAYPADAVVYHRGDPCSEFYFISQGEVLADDQVVGPGAMIGGGDIVFCGRRISTVKTLTSVSMFAVPEHLMDTLDELFPSLFEYIYNESLLQFTLWVQNTICAKVPDEYFAQLPPEFYERLALLFITKVITPGTDFVGLGDPVPGAFFVSAGRFMEEYDSGECTFVLDEGDSYGAMSFFKAEMESETRVVSLGNCVVYMLSIDDFDLLCDKHPEALDMFKYLACEEMKTVLFRKLFSVSELGTMKRYLLKLLNFAHERRTAAMQQRMKMRGTSMLAPNPPSPNHFGQSRQVSRGGSLGGRSFDGGSFASRRSVGSEGSGTQPQRVCPE